MTVVDKGMLKTFLLDRAPLHELSAIERPRPGAKPGFLPVSRQSNLIVESSQERSRASS